MSGLRTVLAWRVHRSGFVTSNKDLCARRAALFQGLYDGSSGRSTPAVRSRFISGGRQRHVRLLNPDGNASDATARRFALLEID